jgi:hypothetical protein
MPWYYEQNTGRLLTPTGHLLAIGYSGFGIGKNNPDLESVHDIGPIPIGNWQTNPPKDHPTLGPCAIPLQPAPGNKAFGRSNFYIHGNLPDRHQDASHGCIIMSRYARDRIAESLDKILTVLHAHPDPAASIP